MCFHHLALGCEGKNACCGSVLPYIIDGLLMRGARCLTSKQSSHIAKPSFWFSFLCTCRARIGRKDRKSKVAMTSTTCSSRRRHVDWHKASSVIDSKGELDWWCRVSTPHLQDKSYKFCDILLFFLRQNIFHVKSKIVRIWWECYHLYYMHFYR